MVPVVLFHAGFARAAGGYVGVDVFFVISGFLITSIIMKELDRGQFSMVTFYERRARRILPALVFVLLACLPAAWLFMNQHMLARFADGLLGVALFASNIVFWLQDGYFEEASEFNPIIHTWSLAVEEQFYILFPLLLLLLVKVFRLTRPGVMATVAALTVISLALSIYSINVSDRAQLSRGAFLLLPARAWELGVGVLCALWLKPRGGKAFESIWSGGLSATGLALILVPVALYHKTTAFPGLASMPPVFGTALIVCFGNPNTVVGAALQRATLVGVGLVSYSLYLWHQPLLAYYRIVTDDIHIPAGTALLLIAASGALAVLSWRYVERPFRNKTTVPRAGIFGLSAASVVGLAAFGAVSLGASAGLERRMAGALQEAEYVHFGNVNERLFTQARLDGPVYPSEAVVVGSSRLMVLSSKVLGRPLLNVSVGGAILEDYVAFTAAAAEATGAKRVLIGADPWLFNGHSAGAAYWTSIEPSYQYWRGVIEGSVAATAPRPKIEAGEPGRFTGLLNDLYTAINLTELSTDDGAVSSQAKRARDGEHIYAADYVMMSEEKRQITYPWNARYRMETYTHSEERQRLFEKLLKHLKNHGLDVTLVLSPYHPDALAIIDQEKLGHFEAEARFRDLAARMNIEILGSYDNVIADCHANEFYDGMHPRPSCIKKILKGDPEDLRAPKVWIR